LEYCFFYEAAIPADLLVGDISFAHVALQLNLNELGLDDEA